MRKIVALVVLIAAAGAFLLFTEPGQNVLRAFGVTNPDCMKSRWLDALGFNVPLCTCCSAPPLPEPPGTR